MSERQPYRRQFVAGWGQMDANGHLANTAYLDLAADVRLSFFSEHGFPPGEFRRLAIGPVVRKDEVEYFREVGLHDAITVTFEMLAMSADGGRYVVQNEIWLSGGDRASTVRSSGGWLDLNRRTLVVPPPALIAALQQVPRGRPFTELPPLTVRER